MLRSRLTKIVKGILELEGQVSTHSVRKFATEEMDRSKLPRTTSDQRGRRKNEENTKTRKASNRYHILFHRDEDIRAAICLAGPQGAFRNDGLVLYVSVCACYTLAAS